MAGRQTRGRQRIPIQRIENQDDMYATFSKRRLGLYKKASELSTLCGADVGIIIFSPKDNPYSFFHPSMESVIERYRNPNQHQSGVSRIAEAHTRARIEHLNTRLDEVLAQKEAIKEREKQLDEMAKNRPKGWWEEPIENLNKEQVKEWMAFFQDFGSRIKGRIEELKNAGVDDPSVFAQNYVPSLDQYPSSIDHNHYYLPPPPPQDPFAAGGSSGNFFGQYGDVPQQGQDPFGDDEAGPSHYYLPPPPQDPSAVGGSFWSFPGPNASVGGGIDEAGPSNQGDADP